MFENGQSKGIIVISTIIENTKLSGKKKRKYKGKENKMENKQSQGYTKTLKDQKLWDFTQYSYCVHPNFLSRTLSKIKHPALFNGHILW